jgi:CMP-N-acetylneuraminic acid synthetase
MSDASVLALVPARGGSKRIPGKNTIALAGRPLIGWTIDAALRSTSITDTVVSTDDPVIAKAAIAEGARVPFMRPEALATDTAATVDVLLHALRTLDADYQFICVLQPTSPLRRPEDIDGAVRLAVERNLDAVISVCPVEHPPE